MAGSPGASLFGLGGSVEANEVRVVGVHVGELYLHHQLQLWTTAHTDREVRWNTDSQRGKVEYRERERERERVMEEAWTHMLLASLFLFPELRGQDSLSLISQPWVLGHLQTDRETLIQR